MARILIVDDDKKLLDLYTLVLQRKRHEVVTAVNAFDGLEQLHERDFDLVLIDATMPYISGFEMVERIRRVEKFQSLQISMFTGRQGKADVERAIRVGANGYIMKPISDKDFMEKVESLLPKDPARGGKVSFGKDVAVALVPMKIESFDRDTLVTTGDALFPQDAVIELSCDVLKPLALSSSRVKVVKCVKDTKTGIVRSHFAFVGLNDIDKQKLAALAATATKKSA